MKNAAGFTLIELMVAMFLSVMVAGLVYASWSSISRHTTVFQRRTQLDTDVQRIGQQISGDIRKSPAIISLQRESVSLISPFNSDTITYALSGENILRNGLPLAFTSRNAVIRSFALTTERGDESSASPDVLITVAVVAANTFGDSSALRFKVRAKEPKKSQGGGIRGWNF